LSETGTIIAEKVSLSRPKAVLTRKLSHNHTWTGQTVQTRPKAVLTRKLCRNHT